MKRVFAVQLLAAILCLNLIMVEAQDENQKPNIVFILTDDFGYGSVNAYGASKELLRTQNTDDLAETGMRFTKAHTPASICTPTRYGFLMGQYPWRSELKFCVTNPLDELLPYPEQKTIADLLKERGYSTAAIGKWIYLSMSTDYM